MICINQIVLEKLKRVHEQKLNGMITKAIWNFYTIYQISKVILKIPYNENDYNTMTLWKLYTISQFQNKNIENKLVNKMERDYIFVNNLLRIPIELGEEQYNEGDIWKEGAIGVASYEMEV